jgi:hypothetical protein
MGLGFMAGKSIQKIVYEEVRMKNLLLLIIGMAFVVSGCANTTAQSNTANTLLAMHDLVKMSAVAADDMCAKSIPPLDNVDTCTRIKKTYDNIRLAYPIASDALVVYLKSNDKTAMQTFLAANAVFVKDYQDIVTMFIQYGVIKNVEGVK